MFLDLYEWSESGLLTALLVGALPFMSVRDNASHSTTKATERTRDRGGQLGNPWGHIDDQGR
jgi:hypothetical protein